MMWDGNGYGGYGAGLGGWMMFAFIIVFVVAVVVGIVFLVRYLAQASSLPAAWSAGMPTAAAAPESPKDVLKRRYAAGEIDRAEYLQTLGDL